MNTKATVSALALLATTWAGAQGMPWAKDYASAKEAASKSGKLIMLDFYTEWWGWCKTLDKETYTDASVIKTAGQFVPLKVDAEKEGKDLAAKYKATGFPTIVFIDAKGDAYGRISGFIPAGMFDDLIQTIAAAHKAYPSAIKTLQTKPGDGKANAVKAMVALARLDFDGATAALDLAEKAGYKDSLLVKVYNLRGDVFQGAGKMDEAIESWLKAYKLATKKEDLYYSLISLAFGYSGKGDKENSRKYAKLFLEMPGSPETYRKLAKSMAEG